ncbi:Kae1-associated serine/threonine protein kinase [Candidatus Woesearchaeota archaeon]|jgi:TP53 regulating kinase and related kinases|nr:Kae1-associated serine/threonine protein kinase [Candidatus Woesearchaeota archaeon]MBT6519283.1 Kae1-associated serine/threonine protein kinase [Candidatus Woesearchaeota archaeon]MBT7368475.1 Kae1-associated serine/threonine protein kinase [Candidatus Woesearchaeota archaeon]
MNSTKTIIAQGAEAIIYLDSNSDDGKVIIKDRFEKTYRHPELDRKLRKSRTRREAKVLEKLQSLGIPAPKLIKLDDKEMKIEMEQIPGNKVRDVFEVDESYKKLSLEVGQLVAMIHKNGIIHGDLTTSNMILNSKDNKIYLIDFGLSFFSEKEEDKAVDIHLLKQALESKHYKIFEDCFKLVIQGYKENSSESDAKAVLARFEKVELRGRYKMKKLK